MICILLFLLILCVIHCSALNILKKMIFTTIFGIENTRRPCSSCIIGNDKYNASYICYGMPSGHAECTTIFMILLSIFGYIPFELAIIVILGVCIQRVISQRHTVLQVVIGVLFGMLYSLIYIYLLQGNAEWYGFLMCILFALLMIFVYSCVLLLIKNKEKTKYDEGRPCQNLSWHYYIQEYWSLHNLL